MGGIVRFIVFVVFLVIVAGLAQGCSDPAPGLSDREFARLQLEAEIHCGVPARIRPIDCSFQDVLGGP